MLIAARELNSADLPSQSCDQPAHRLHARVRGGRVAEQRGEQRRIARLLPAEHPDADGAERDQARRRHARRRSTSARTSAATSLVDAEQKEFNYQTPGETRPVHPLPGQGRRRPLELPAPRRVRVALRRHQPADLGPDHPDTRVLMERDIRDRVDEARAVPALRRRPVPGRARATRRSGSSTGTRRRAVPVLAVDERRGRARPSFNYVRNSVKVTVDAYEGTVTFYVVDPKDPIIQAYREAFPDLFTDRSQMSAELRKHLRYPEDLFKVQSNTFGRYHVTEPAPLLRRQREVAGVARPRLRRGVDHRLHAVVDAASTASNSSGQPQAATSTGRRIDPYYLYLKLPQEESEHFIVLVPFVPVSSANRRNEVGLVPDRQLRCRPVRGDARVHDAAG